MRFLADGPNIPDELLEARDRGEVVFLCGAGVSYPAGMPNFLGLAQHVIQELGTPPGAPSREMLSFWDNGEISDSARPSLDQIFNLLQMEYEVGEIESLIAKRLRTRPQTDVSTHKTLLRLSRSADGKPQIVTTNFDLLFQDTSISLARLAGVTGNNFPEAVQTILPRLVHIYKDSWFLHHVMSRGGIEEIELATEFPEATLVLVNKLVPDNPPERLFDLNLILEKIGEAKPSLRQDWQWERLKRIARQE